MWNDAEMSAENTPYYRADLALIHHRGFAFHAEDCAPGILSLLEPVRARDGLVVELGCGSGLLTKYLVDAGHRVIATDASPAMLNIARGHAGSAQEIRRLTLPDDPIPDADAIVSVGHVLNYLPDAASVERALVAAAEALRPDGVLAIDLCDLSY
jgi:SAM-dependent methyltransferase